MAKGRFVTAISCMDGRVQLPVINWLRDNYRADYVDMITQPGPIKLLSENQEAAVAVMRRCVEVSVKHHNSRLVAVVGHLDCAGNPVGKDEQLRQIATSVQLIKGWGLEEGVEVIGLWVDGVTSPDGALELGQVERVI